MKGAIAKGLDCDPSAVTVENFDKSTGTADVRVAVDPPPSKEAIAMAFEAAGGKYKVR